MLTLRGFESQTQKRQSICFNTHLTLIKILYSENGIMKAELIKN